MRPSAKRETSKSSAARGVALNTALNNARSFHSANGRELIFSSNRRGNWDLFVATRSESGARFEEVVALGPEVNSDVDEGSPA